MLVNLRQSQISCWDIPRHPGELVLMMTEDTLALLGGDDPTLGWSRHADSVRRVRVEGHHANYFTGELGKAFAGQILALAVESVEGSGVERGKGPISGGLT